MTGIYMIRNIENGKVYIGQSLNIEKRWHDHKYRLSTNCHENGHLQHAYNKTPELFVFDLICECPDWLLDDLEEYYINLYEAFDSHFGYNIEIKPRGTGKHSDDTCRKISERKMGHPVSSETRKRLSDALKGQVITDKTRNKMSESSTRKRQVICVETGTIYKSIASASAEVGIADSAIGACCRGDSETCGGRHWAYLADYEANPEYYTDILRTYIPKRNSFGVMCVEKGISYKSALEAERQTGIKNSSICECCRGKRNTAGGFHWMYNNDAEGTRSVDL